MTFTKRRYKHVGSSGGGRGSSRPSRAPSSRTSPASGKLFTPPSIAHIRSAPPSPATTVCAVAGAPLSPSPSHPPAPCSRYDPQPEPPPSRRRMRKQLSITRAFVSHITCSVKTGQKRGHTLSDTMHPLISFSKSTPPRNRQLNIQIAIVNNKLTIFWGS